MRRKKASALVGLWMILLASFALVAQIPLAYATAENHRYWVMGGKFAMSSEQLGTVDFWHFPFVRPPYFRPLFRSLNVTFSDPDLVTGIIDLTVPADTYDAFVYHTYDPVGPPPDTWYRIRMILEEHGYGWLFTGTGSNPILGDVDVITFNNYTGMYFFGPDGLAGTADDSFAGPGPPPVGGDGVPGTGDDGFGDGTQDPPGSSILYLNLTIYTDMWTGVWSTLVVAPLHVLFTTAEAYDIVMEPASLLNGVYNMSTGEPWEFIAGIEHPPSVPYGHPKWNAYVTYASAWSGLNISTSMGPLDIMGYMTQSLVREDCVIADINCDEACNIIDIVIAALSFDKKDESIGPDGIPNTDDDVKWGSPNPPDMDFDARGDISPVRGKVNIVDIVRIALDFDEKLEP